MAKGQAGGLVMGWCLFGLNKKKKRLYIGFNHSKLYSSCNRPPRQGQYGPQIIVYLQAVSEGSAAGLGS